MFCRPSAKISSGPLAPTSEPFLRAGPGLPAVFGKHVLLSKLATGGMGEVFLARMRGAAGFEKLLVLKRLLPHLGEQPRFVTMFLDEARLAARISHANVCQIYELGQVEQQYYITMEYLEGAQLSQVIERRRLDPRLADLQLLCGVLTQVCEGLHAAHNLRNDDGELLGVVHRDVCLSNIFVTWSGIAKLIDFGVAKARGALSKTRPGAVKGTYAYMSPEQLRGEDVQPRSDVFAMGVVAWESITGRRLFKRKTDFQTFKAITEEPIPLASELRPEVPSTLARAVRRALEREPSRRYQTAREFGRALEEGIEGLGPPRVPLGIAEVMREAFSADIDRHRAQIAAIYRGSTGDDDKEFESTATEEMPLGARRRLATDVDEEAQRATHPLIRMPLPAPVTTTGTVAAPEPSPDADEAPDAEELEQLRTAPAEPTDDEPVDDDTTDFEIFDEGTSVEQEIADMLPEESSRSRRLGAVPLLLAGIVATLAVIAYMLMRSHGPSGDGPAAAGKAARVEQTPSADPGVDTANGLPEVTAVSVAEATPPNAIVERAGDAGTEAKPRRAGARDAKSADAAVPAAVLSADAGSPPAVAVADAGAAPATSEPVASPRHERAKHRRPKHRDGKTKKPTTATSAHSKPQEPGFLTVDSSPYATIYLDGKKLGYTPIVDQRLASGKHTLRAVSSAGGQERTVTITVKPGKHLRRKLRW